MKNSNQDSFFDEPVAARVEAWALALEVICRSKGVLAVKGYPNRMVFKGIHMLFDGKFDRPWSKEPRTNTLIFIGRNLDRAALNAGFRACLA